MSGPILDNNASLHQIDDWFRSTPRHHLISALADIVWEWRKSDLSRLRLMERELSQEDIVKLLRTWHDSRYNPVIHLLVDYDQTSTLLSLLPKVSHQDLLSLIEIKGWRGVNVLSHAVKRDLSELSGYLFKQLDGDESFNLLCEWGEGGMTGLHWAVDANNAIGEVLRLLKSMSRSHHLLSIRDDEGRTVLSYSIYCGGDGDSFQSIIDHYCHNPRELLELAVIIDNQGNTSFHYAAGQETPDFLVTLIKATCSVSTRDKLASVLSMRNASGDKKRLGDYVTEYHSDNELIYDWAFNSLKNDRYLLFDFPSVLIMYNTKGRPNAHKEADSLEACFIDLGFKFLIGCLSGGTVHYYKSSFTEDELFQAIKEQQDLPASRNGQIVSLMSHGHEGYIEDSNGVKILLRRIEQHMCVETHLNTPKLLILQCCQGRSSPALGQSAESDSQLSPESTSSFVQSDTRAGNREAPPGSYGASYRDFCALMSTGARTVSVRNKFIPYLAQAIRNVAVDVGVPQMMVSVTKRFPEDLLEQSPGSQVWFKFNLCLKNILPIYLKEMHKVKSEAQKRKLQERSEATSIQAKIAK